MYFLLVLLAVRGIAAYAAEGEPFTAVSSTNLAAKAASGNQVTVSFSARVFNDGPADVHDATITLQHAGFSKPLATFPGISIPKGGSVVLTQEISVPKALYSSWNQGRVMALRITAKDADGNQTCHFIPLATQH